MKSQVILVCWKLQARNYSRLIVAKVRLGMTGEKFQRKVSLTVKLIRLEEPAAAERFYWVHLMDGHEKCRKQKLVPNSLLEMSLAGL